MESIWNSFFEPQPRPRFAPTPRGDTIIRPAATCSPKVVSVPVRFVCSDRRRSESAVKIQKAFRGFMVRKSVKRIAELKREVDEVDRTISRPETVEKIRQDEKERLRLNETLMSSLLRLDSVRGVDSGVRDCRKAVIKKAIVLQERIDSIASVATVEADVEPVCEADHDELESNEPEINCLNLSGIESVQEETVEQEERTIHFRDDPTPHWTDSQKDIDEEVRNSQSLTNSESPMEAKESREDSGSESESEMVKAGQKEAKSDGDQGSNVLMERMLEDSEKLMGLMAELYERTEAQTRLLSSLSRRVDQLERAYVSDKLAKKKKTKTKTKTKKQRRCCDVYHKNNY